MAEYPANLTGDDLVPLKERAAIGPDRLGISERTWRRWRREGPLATLQANATLGAWTRAHPGDDLRAFLAWARQPDRSDLDCPCSWRREAAEEIAKLGAAARAARDAMMRATKRPRA